MDIFDRLGNLIRTILDDEGQSSEYAGGFTDPDERAAWEELESYMRDEEAQARAERAGAWARTAAPGGMPASLRRDFRNLEVPVGAPLAEVRSSYKRLMARFHPDRHADNPEKLRTATEVTKELNQSFARIRTFYEGEA